MEGEDCGQGEDCIKKELRQAEEDDKWREKIVDRKKTV